METMSSDERVIVNAFGFRDVDETIHQANNQLLPNEKAHSTSLLYEDLWRTMAVETIEALVHIYRTDLTLFDYPDHPLK